jgi:hypothetical protein
MAGLSHAATLTLCQNIFHSVPKELCNEVCRKAVERNRKYEEGLYIPDSYKDDRCAQDAIRLVELHPQLIFPLVAPRIGWPGSGAFGVLTIGNIPKPMPGSVEEDILQRVARTASDCACN